MADDRMKHDDVQRNMGGTSGREGQGQQSPGRSQGGQQGGQQAGGPQGGQQGQQGKQGGQIGGEKNAQNMEDDDEFAGGGQNRGGQNR